MIAPELLHVVCEATGLLHCMTAQLLASGNGGLLPFEAAGLLADEGWTRLVSMAATTAKSACLPGCKIAPAMAVTGPCERSGLLPGTAAMLAAAPACEGPELLAVPTAVSMAGADCKLPRLWDGESTASVTAPTTASEHATIAATGPAASAHEDASTTATAAATAARKRRRSDATAVTTATAHEDGSAATAMAAPISVAATSCECRRSAAAAVGITATATVRSTAAAARLCCSRARDR